jgi:hypothetical protein
MRSIGSHITFLVFATIINTTISHSQTDTSSFFPRGLWGIWLDADTLVSPYPPHSLSPIQWDQERDNFSSISANYLVAWIPYTIYDSLMQYTDDAGYRIDMNMSNWYSNSIFNYSIREKVLEYQNNPSALSDQWKDSVNARIAYMRTRWGTQNSFYTYFVSHEADLWGGRYPDDTLIPDTSHWQAIDYVLKQIKYQDSNPVHKSYIVHWGKMGSEFLPFAVTLADFARRFPDLGVYQSDRYVFSNTVGMTYSDQQPALDSLLIGYDDCYQAFRNSQTEWHAVI